MPDGGAPILWKESGVGVLWAVIHLSGGGEGSKDGSVVWIRITDSAPHPMKGRVLRTTTGSAFHLDNNFPDEIDIFRYPTYDTNEMYSNEDTIAAYRVNAGAYVSLDMLPTNFRTVEGPMLP